MTVMRLLPVLACIAVAAAQAPDSTEARADPAGDPLSGSRDDTHILGYTMRQTQAGWKAIDVTADSSISQVVAQQEEIRSLVHSSGAGGLLTRLKQKTTELFGGSVR